jgi:hypothetical protein
MTKQTGRAWSRRLVIGAGSAAMVAAGASQAAAAEQSLADDIRTFVDFGEHRCGAEGERRTARWLAERLKASGYGVRTEAFPVKTYLDPGGIFSSGDLTTPAFPQWRAPAGAFAGPIVAPLRPLGQATPGCIAVAEHLLAPGAYWAKQQDLAVAAKAAGAAALVIGFDEPTDQIFTCNQESEADLPLPVGEIRKSALLTALAHAQAGGRGSLALKGTPTATHGLFLAAHNPGVGEAIVISTPLTGWFRCGAERGPGVALLLKLARDLAKSKRPVWLFATGGHELGHQGMRLALKMPTLPRPDAVAVWVHLGAGIAADALDGQYGVHAPRALTIAADLEPEVGSLFPASDWTPGSPKPTAPGEAGDIIAAGYTRIVGLAGGFPGFHTRIDDGSAVDYAKLTSVGEGLSGFLTGL